MNNKIASIQKSRVDVQSISPGDKLLPREGNTETRHQSASLVLRILASSVRDKLDVEAMRSRIRVEVDFNLGGRNKRQSKFPETQVPYPPT